MNIQIIKYGLYHKKLNYILGLCADVIPLDEDNANIEYYVGPNYNNQWLVNSFKEAETIKNDKSDKKYNNSERNPINPYVPEQLEVIKIIQNIESNL